MFQYCLAHKPPVSKTTNQKHKIADSYGKSSPTKSQRKNASLFTINVIGHIHKFQRTFNNEHYIDLVC